MGRRAANPHLGSAVVGLIGTRGPMSRSAIARTLGVSAATITNVTKRLIHEGTVVEAGTRPSDGGRPLVLLDVVPERRYALGVKVTPNHLTMAEVDISGEPGPSVSIDLDMRSPDALDRICAAIGNRIADRTGQLLGIGLALPGYASPTDPDVVSAPVLGWNGLNLGRLLRDRTGLTVVIDNDVNALAVADHLYSGQPAGNALLVTIGYGIGCALTVNGRVHHGAHGGAGEIGHTYISPTGIECACGLHDCLETMIGDDALVARARREGLLRNDQGKDELNSLADNGDTKARALFRDAGHHLALAVSNLAHTLDPDTITISGEGVDVWQHWEPGFLATLRQRLPQTRRDIPVTIHPWSDDTWAYGAASLVFAQPFQAPRASHTEARKSLH